MALPDDDKHPDPNKYKLMEEDKEEADSISVVSDVQSFVSDDLDQRFSRQQEMIKELREIMVAEEAARSQKRIKIEKCASQLAKIRDRAKTTKMSANPRQSQSDSASIVKKTSEGVSTSVADPVPRKDVLDSSGSATPITSHNVTKMLHQQIREHKAIIAERAKSEKELEDALAKIQKQLQQTQNQAAQLQELGSSKPAKELLIQTDSNKQIAELQSKVLELQATVTDLQETCKEKDSVIEAKTKAITLMSADLSLKGKNTLDLLNDTKEQMQKMQLNFTEMEKEMSEENMMLKNRIKYLEEANSILETERFKLTVENTELEENLKLKNSEIEDLKLTPLPDLENNKDLLEKIEKLELANKELLEREDTVKKIEALENINKELRQSNIELQEQFKQQSPKKQSKQKKEVKTDKNIENYETIIANLNKQILEKEIQLNETQNVKDLENKLAESEAKLSELNKSLIKTKATHKSKVKQMQKCIDDFTKVSDANSELVRLQNEVKVLSLKVAELEEDKGNLQLHLVDYDSGRVSDSQLHSKLMEIETVAEERLKAIADLETQKFDLVQDLHLAKINITNLEDKVAELSYLESEHVSSEINSVQMEEQLEKIKNNVKKLELELSAAMAEKEELIKDNSVLKNDKLEITNKLESYIQENLDLTDKLEKLTAEKVSSAESIEMVEKLEVENYQKQCQEPDEDPQIEDQQQMINEEKVTDDFALQKLKEELQSLETEKNNLYTENEKLINEIESLTADISEFKKLETERNSFNQKMEELENENTNIKSKSHQLNDELDLIKNNYQEEINKLTENLKKYEEDINNLNVFIENQEVDKNSMVVELKKLNSLEEENKKLNIALQEMQKNVEKIDTLTQTVEEKTDKSKNVKNLTKEILRLKNQLKSQENEVQKLTEVNEKTKEDSQAKLAECESLQRELETFKADSIEGMKSKDETISNLTNQINQLEIVSKKLQNTLSQVENEKCLSLQQNDEMKQLENNLAFLKNSNSELEKIISNLDNELREKQKSIELLKGDLDHNKNDVKNLKDQINEYNKQIHNITKEKDDVLLEMSKIKTEIKEKDEELHEIKLQLRKESIEFERIKAELEEKCQKYETSENTFKEEIENLDKKCKEQLEKLKKYSATLKKKTNLCTEMESKIASLTESLQSKDQENIIGEQLEVLKKQLDNSNSINQNLQEQLLEKEVSIASLESSLQRFCEVEKEIQGKKCEIDNLVEKLEELQLSYDQYKSAQEAKLQEREMYLETLEQELSAQKNKTWQLEETVSAIEEKRVSLQRKSDALVGKLEQKDKEYFNHGDQMEKEIASLKEQGEILKQELENSKIEKENLIPKLSEIEKTNKDLVNEIEMLKSEINNNKKDLSQFYALQEDRLADLDRISHLENELKRLHYENSEIIKIKSSLESELQNHVKDNEEQQNFIKEQRDKFHEELVLQVEKLNVLENDLDILKSENDHLRRLYDAPKASTITQTELDDREEKINNLQTQFTMCLSQLSEATESEKLYKEKCAEQERIIKEMNETLSKSQNKSQDIQEVVQKRELKDIFATPSQTVQEQAQINMWQDLEDQIIVTESLQDIESQIIQTDNIQKSCKVEPDNEHMIRSFQHDPQVSIAHFKEPVLPEEELKPKKTYVCQEDPESLKIKNDKLSEELQTVKQKLGKSIKKLKDMKSKHDQLETEVKQLRTTSDFSLDFAIQDELASQVKTLEETIVEIRKEQQKEKLEKENLLKRIDTITTANEKLIEAKEKYDIQLELYEIQNKGLAEKVKNLEWNTNFTNDDDNFPSEESELRSKINELESEKEELQSLLSQTSTNLNPLESFDEFKSLKAEFDLVSKERDNLQTELKISNDNVNAELNLVKIENDDLRINLEKLVKEYSEFQDKYNNIALEKDKIELENASLFKDIEDLQIRYQQTLEHEKLCKTEVHKLAYENEELTEKYDALLLATKDLSKLQEENSSLREKLSQLAEENTKYQSHITEMQENMTIATNQRGEKNEEIAEKYNELLQANNDLSNLQEENSSLREKVTQLTEENLKYKTHITEMQENLNSATNQRSEENEELAKKYNKLLLANEDLSKLEEENLLLREKLTQLTEENHKYQSHINEMQENLTLAINKRGEEIAELWKQHLSMREKEFEEAQKALYEQISDGTELNELKIRLEELLNEKNKHEVELQETQQLRQKLAETEDAVHEKDVEMANLRLSFHSEKSNLDSEITGLREQLLELKTLAEEESQQLSQMRTALESQEIEIVTLKENLAVHTHAYDKLNELYLLEKAKPKLEKHVSFAEDTKPGDESQPAESEEKPQRADIDLALYMLYQRDMRCEELTVELMQLLEERDTLQLKLSNAIKTIEDLKPRQDVQTTAVTEAPEKPVPEATATAASSSLETKLSQLHHVGHVRDIRLRDEREERQKQMELLHRDLENLPPEAAAKLREAHYTLSRDTQSTSTVLLNWLWGKTTPKVVHM